MEMTHPPHTALLAKIEKSRQQLIQFGLEKGFTDQNTIELSQELDNLINEYLYMENTMQKTNCL